MLPTRTSRLQISKFTLADAPFFLELANSPNWIKYIGDRNLKTVKDAEDYLKQGTLKSYNEFGFGFYKLSLKDSNIPVGTCGLIKRDTLDDVDLGFAMLPQFEGKGFGYESSVKILELAKSSFQIDRVAAITLPINKNSIKLIEKLGFKLQKKVKPFDDGEELLLFAKVL